MTIWVTTDWHLRHKNIVQLEGRPANFEDLILKSVQVNVKAGDTLIHLGDLYLGRSSEFIDYISNFIVKDTTFINIKGNHDGLSATKLATAGIIQLESLMLNGIYMSHYGSEVLPDYAGGQVFGHYHSNKAPESLTKPNDYRLSIEEEEYKLVRFDQLITRINRKTVEVVLDENRHNT